MTQKYDSVKASAFASGSVPNGYFGKRSKVDFSILNNHIMIVADCGFYNSGLPPVLDVAEALWILKHHPSARHIIVD